MANDEHVEMLKKGVKAWNAWRLENPTLRPDLSGAHLSHEYLFQANLARCGESQRGGPQQGGPQRSEPHRGEPRRGEPRRGEPQRRGPQRLSHVRCIRLESETGAGQAAELGHHLRDEPEITVDNIEVAQFIYLMLHNQKVRDVIDTITSKVVLILGRFTDERKAVLDGLREELRKRDYLPILFDFNVPATRDITETVSLLARMARFIVADLTDPSSIPKELEAIVPDLAVPVQPLLEGASRPYAMFKDYWKYDWVLPICWYERLEPLLATLAEKVIAPAEGKVKALEERRRMIEAELTKPQ
jgi:hypothetical protein